MKEYFEVIYISQYHSITFLKNVRPLSASLISLAVRYCFQGCSEKKDKIELRIGSVIKVVKIKVSNFLNDSSC